MAKISYVDAWAIAIAAGFFLFDSLPDDPQRLSASPSTGLRGMLSAHSGIALPTPAAAPQSVSEPSPLLEQAVEANARIPFVATSLGPAAPFTLDASSLDRQHAVACLAAAIYYEAGSESEAGQAAVAQVVINRLKRPQFPKSICGVVFQRDRPTSGCQFSFTCDGSLNRGPSAAAWRRATDLAERALDGYVMGAVGQATHYHADYVVPAWAHTLSKEIQIGAHIFYVSGPAPGRMASADAAQEAQDWGMAAQKLAGASEAKWQELAIVPRPPLQAQSQIISSIPSAVESRAVIVPLSRVTTTEHIVGSGALLKQIPQTSDYYGPVAERRRRPSMTSG